MARIILLYQWPVCKMWSIKELLNKLNLQHNKNSIDFHTSLMEYAANQKIPIHSPVARMSNKLSISQENVNLWQLSQRFHYISMGVITWEIAFSITNDSIYEKSIEKIVKINGKNILSNAIFTKHTLCKEYDSSQTLCFGCKETRVFKIATIRVGLITNTNQNSMSTINQFFDSPNLEIKDFILNGNKWHILKSEHIILLKKRQNYNRKKFLEQVVMIISFVYALKYFSKKLLSSTLRKIKKEILTTSPDIILTKTEFFKIFFTIYFWSNPDFILNKQSERPFIKSIYLNGLSFLYICLMDDDFWDINEQLLKNLSIMPVSVFFEFHKIASELPGNILSDMLKLYTPLNYSWSELSINLTEYSELEQKICYAMGRELIERQGFIVGMSPPEILKSGAKSTSGMCKLLGISKGSSSVKVNNALNALVYKQLLIAASPKDVGHTKQAKILYYLSPYSPYSQFILFQSR